MFRGGKSMFRVMNIPVRMNLCLLYEERGPM